MSTPPSRVGRVMLGSAAGRLIDGIPSFGRLIFRPAKRLSSATYQPYKHTAAHKHSVWKEGGAEGRVKRGGPKRIEEVRAEGTLEEMDFFPGFWSPYPTFLMLGL